MITARLTQPACAGWLSSAPSFLRTREKSFHLHFSRILAKVFALTRRQVFTRLRTHQYDTLLFEKKAKRRANSFVCWIDERMCEVASTGESVSPYPPFLPDISWLSTVTDHMNTLLVTLPDWPQLDLKLLKESIKRRLVACFSSFWVCFVLLFRMSDLFFITIHDIRSLTIHQWKVRVLFSFMTPPSSRKTISRAITILSQYL